MRENRILDDKMTIRCNKENADKVRRICKRQNKTLNELLVEDFLAGERKGNTQVKLNDVSKECMAIEEALINPQDKEILGKEWRKYGEYY